jgi:hypothetical protein
MSQLPGSQVLTVVPSTASHTRGRLELQTAGIEDRKPGQGGAGAKDGRVCAGRGNTADGEGQHSGQCDQAGGYDQIQLCSGH